MKNIIEKTTLNSFLGQLTDLNPDKMFYGPNDIFGHAKVKMTLEQLIQALTDYDGYWRNEIDEDTLFYVPLEYTDAYVVSMSNTNVDWFDPFLVMN